MQHRSEVLPGEAILNPADESPNDSNDFANDEYAEARHQQPRPQPHEGILPLGGEGSTDGR